MTLRPGASVARVLAQMPSRTESIKDSFACLDLAPEGFSVLMDARWIVHRAPRAAATARVWRAVERADELDDWARAAGLEGIIRAELLADSAIRVLAGRDSKRGPIVAGAIAIATGRVVGLSNVFSDESDGETVWGDVQAVTAMAFPARPIVGYERGDALAHALASGFSPLRALRVWYREGGSM